MSENPVPVPTEAEKLLTIPEAAVVTGLSVKALRSRVDRGTLPCEVHRGLRMIRRGELERRNLIGAGGRAEQGGEDPAGELVVWRQLYERERQERTVAEAQRAELHAQLAAIANAGPFRAMRLRRLARRQFALDAACQVSLSTAPDGDGSP